MRMHFKATGGFGARPWKTGFQSNTFIENHFIEQKGTRLRTERLGIKMLVSPGGLGSKSS